MANTGIVNDLTEPLYSQNTVSPHTPGTATPFQWSPGQIIHLHNGISASSIRSTLLTVDITASGTQQSFAHGLVNEYGSGTVPYSIDMYAASGTYFSSQAPDATNIYLTSPGTAPNTVTVRLYY